MVVLKLIEEMKIEAANLGDSGYALFHVLEDDTLDMYFRSPAQQKTHNFPFQCGGETGDNPEEAEEFLHEDVRDGDVALVFSDGFHDNVFDSGMVHCMEEYLYGGLITSLSRAADCLARKAYFLGKNPEFQSPWMKEFKHFKDVGIPVMNQPPENFPYMGGKADDITVTVAQIFTDKGADDPRRQLAAQDTYFESQKTIYTGGVYDNSHEPLLRARFNEREDKAQKPVSKDQPTREKVLELVRIAQMNQMLAAQREAEQKQ